MLLLLLYVVAILLLGSFHIGGLTIRVSFTLVMIIYLFFNRKRTSYKLNVTPVIIYFIFLIISFIMKLLSCGFSGVDEIKPFTIRLFSHFLVCFVSFFAIERIVNSAKDLTYLLILLILICVINALVTWLQFTGNELGIALGAIFSTSKSDYLLNIAENIERLSEIKIAMPGIFGHGAVNGYMTSSLGILSLYYLIGNGRKYWIWGLLFYSISLIGSFCCQERSGFLLLVFFSILSFWKFNSKAFTYIIPILFLIISYWLYDNIINSDIAMNSRFSNFNKADPLREQIVSNALTFISNNVITGGDELYNKIYGLTPHNVILHAFIFSGIIGAVIILYLTYYMIKDAYKAIIGSRQLLVSFFFASGLTIYLINGLVHSSSLITGEVMIWILYACLLRSLQVEKISDLPKFREKLVKNRIYSIQS